MKTLLLTIAALAAFAVSASAQSVYAISDDGSSLVNYTTTNATTVITNLSRTPFRLTAVAGGQSYLGWTISSVTGTNATQTNRVLVTCATAALDSSLGPWKTNLGFTSDATGGTNRFTTVGETNLGSSVRFVKVVGLTVNGTNVDAAAGSTVTFRFHQHR